MSKVSWWGSKIELKFQLSCLPAWLSCLPVWLSLCVRLSWLLVFFSWLPISLSCLLVCWLVPSENMCHVIGCIFKNNWFLWNRSYPLLCISLWDCVSGAVCIFCNIFLHWNYFFLSHYRIHILCTWHMINGSNFFVVYDTSFSNGGAIEFKNFRKAVMGSKTTDTGRDGIRRL